MAWSVPQETRIPKSLLCEYSDTFSLFDGDVGCTSVIYHEIPLVDDIPVCQQYRRLLPLSSHWLNSTFKNCYSRALWEWAAATMPHPLWPSRRRWETYDSALTIDNSTPRQGKTPTHFPISGTNGWERQGENGILYPVWPLHSLTRCHSGYATRPGHYRVWWSESLATRVSNLSRCI